MAEGGAFSDQVKGVAFITIGVILLLQKLGILTKSFDFYVVVFIALYLIVIGFMKIDGTRRLQKLMKRGEQ